MVSFEFASKYGSFTSIAYSNGVFIKRRELKEIIGDWKNPLALMLQSQYNKLARRERNKERNRKKET